MKKLFNQNDGNTGGGPEKPEDGNSTNIQLTDNVVSKNEAQPETLKDADDAATETEVPEGEGEE